MITKEMLIGEVVDQYPATVPVFMQSGMGCIGCAIAHGESIADGAMVHGIDADALVNALNQAIA